MADDINLPNLVSHLSVDLDRVNGTIADAGRQGSSVGAALGGGIQRELQGLLAHLPDIPIDANSDEVDRDLARVRREMERLSNQRIGVDISIQDALRQINQLQPHLARLSDEHPEINVQAATRAAARQLDELIAAAHRADRTDVDIDVDVDVDRPNRLTGIVGRLGSVAKSATGALAGVGKSAAVFGSAVPLVASVVQTLANVAPAAGVAVTGMAAVQLASGTVKLAAVGMGDALGAALDPSKAQDYAEALKKLSPEARKFASAVHDAAPELRALQQSVQDRVFKGLGDQLERTGKSVLPVLKTNLQTSAGALNNMATGSLMAAKELGDSGTLGQALGSASKGLTNLSGLPAVVVTSLGQVAAAAGPSFEKLTAGAGKAATGIGDKLAGAFKSGAMQDAIETAVGLLHDLWDVAGNVMDIVGGIFSAVPAGGGGLINTLQQVTAAIADVINTDGVQNGLSALFQTMGTVASTVAPLLGMALSALGPVLAALGPPVQLIVQQLGAALGPVIKALGPVLTAAAEAVGQLLTALAPLLPVIGQLVAGLLPVLVPLFQMLAQVFTALAPVIQQVADVLLAALGPILAALPSFIQPLADLFVQLAETLLPVIADLFAQLAPSLVELGVAFGQLLVAAAPIIAALGQLAVLIISQLMPVIQPLIGLAISLATTLASLLAGTITNVVVPVLQFLAKLLTGDFSGAWQMAKSAVGSAASWVAAKSVALGNAVMNGVNAAVGWLRGLPGRALSALGSLASSLAAPAISAGTKLASTIRDKIGEAVGFVKSLPGKAKSVLGGLSGVLTGAGRQLIQGFINGVKGMFSSVKNTLGSLTDKLTDWKGPPKKDAKILTPAGRLLIEGFIKGIDGTTAKLRSRLEQITKALPANTKSGIGKTLAKATRELEKEVTKRDAVLKKLASAQKNLDNLKKARDKASSDITKGILDEANITSGHADVNSVSAITVGLQQSLKQTKDFEANIAKLKKSGLRSDLLQQIADAGVEGGSATAAALAKATPAELKKINDLQSQLAKSASSTGKTVGDALYGAGVNAAAGLVAGLKSQERKIEKAMERIAENMLKVTKKKHKTKSPSKAFADIGRMDMEGLRGGVLAHAHRAVGAVSDVASRALAAASGVGGAFAGTPSPGQIAAVYAGRSRGDQTNHFHLYGSDAGPDGILRALSWQGLLGKG